MKVLAVCMLLLFLCLGGVAAGCGFSALNTSNTREYHVLLVNDMCIYPDSPAQTSGLLAGLILLLAQMLIIVTCGCTCRGADKKQMGGRNTAMAGLGCILGCFAAGLGAAFFASGSALSRPGERYRLRHGTNTAADCLQPRWTVAIALLFCSQFLGILSYIAILREERNAVLTVPLPPVALPESPPPHPNTPPPIVDQLPV